MHSSKLAAFKIDRRSIAAVLLADTRIDYLQVRTLLADERKGRSSALGFVRWFARSFDVQAAALEKLPAASTIRRATLTDAITETLRSTGVSVALVEKAELLAAFGHPPLTTRKALREVLLGIWPGVEAERNEHVIDAAALGLYVQVERQLQLTQPNLCEDR